MLIILVLIFKMVKYLSTNDYPVQKSLKKNLFQDVYIITI